MEFFEKYPLQDCPYCGGAGLLEEEGGWIWSVSCLDCGAHTAPFEFKSPDASEEAASNAAHMWNIGKVLRGDGE